MIALRYISVHFRIVAYAVTLCFDPVELPLVSKFLGC